MLRTSGGTGAQFLPALKPEVEIVQRSTGSRVWYLVNDRSTENHFRINLVEYAVLSMCDGSRSVHQVGDRIAKLFPDTESPHGLVFRVVKWAQAARLFRQTDSQVGVTAPGGAMPAVGKFNPFAFRISFGSPDALIDRSIVAARYVLAVPVLLMLMSFVAYSFFMLLANGRFFNDEHLLAVSKGDWIWFLASWIALKLLHESSHAIACRKHGGAVNDCGVFFLFGIPMPWVDVTSSLNFRSRWQRILVCIAGMFAESVVAAVACLVWLHADPGPVQFHSRNVILVASAYTVLFNANPLMRFDGYYVLSELLGIPSLYTQGRAFVRSTGNRLFFGIGQNPIRETGWRGLFVRVYGFASLIWSIFISVSMVVVAFTCLPGLGILVGVVAILFWILLPAFHLVRHFFVGRGVGSIARIRFLSAVTLLIGGGYFLLNSIPVPGGIRVPVVIDYRPMHVVRAQAPGFVSSILVQPGDSVARGEVIAVMENPKLQCDLKILQLEIERSKLRLNAMLEAGKIADVQMEQLNLDDLRLRHHELKSYADNMRIASPGDGQILDSDIVSRLGTFLKPGDALIEIGNARNLCAVGMMEPVSITQIKTKQCDTFDTFIHGVDKKTRVRSPHFLPRAQTRLAHQALAASNGGPLAVVANAAGGEASMDPWTLPQPRFSVEFLIEESVPKLRAGQTGVVTVTREKSTLLECAKSYVCQLMNRLNSGQQGF